MKKMYDERMTLLKLIVAAALLSLPLHIIYEAFTAENIFEETVSNQRVAINIAGVFNSLLYECFIIFLVTLFVLLAIRFLYLSLTDFNKNKLK